jgi:hypothetical protein
MSVRPIIDAGPGLNFLSVNKERLLIAVLGRFSAPETVRDEVLRRSRQDERFTRCRNGVEQADDSRLDPDTAR